MTGMKEDAVPESRGTFSFESWYRKIHNSAGRGDQKNLKVLKELAEGQ